MKKALNIFLYTALSVLFCLYIAYRVMDIPMNTDGSCMMLYAEDILSGNLFLSDWSLTGLTFLTTDLPFYIIGVAIFGVGINAFHTAVALMYIFMAGSAVLAAVTGTKNKKNAVLIMSAVGIFPTTYALSNAFVHTAVFAYAFLAAYFALRFNEQGRKSWLVPLGIITALAVSGDNMALVLITVPLILICIFRLFLKPFPAAFSVLSGTAAGVLIQKLYLFIGGADLNSLPHQEFIAISDFGYNIRTYIDYFFRLVNSYFFTKDIFSVKTAVFGIKVLIVLFAVYVMYSAVKSAILSNDSDIPTTQFGISLGIITVILWLTTLNANLTAGRYIAFLPLALGMALARCADFLVIFRKPKATAAISVLLIALTAANLIPGGSRLSAYNTYSEAAEFLADKGLTNGYAAFWDSSVLTGYSRNKVKVRAVVCNDNGELMPHIWFCKNSWYDEPANFIIVRNDGFAEEEAAHNYNGIFNMRFDGGMEYGITPENIKSTLGEPKEVIDFKNYSIYIYNNIILER